MKARGAVRRAKVEKRAARLAAEAKDRAKQARIRKIKNTPIV